MSSKRFRPRKPCRLTYIPPTRPGWYAVAEQWGTEVVAIKLDEDGIQDAKQRYELAMLFGWTPPEIWSTRKLKKRERGGAK